MNLPVYLQNLIKLAEHSASQERQPEMPPQLRRPYSVTEFTQSSSNNRPLSAPTDDGRLRSSSWSSGQSSSRPSPRPFPRFIPVSCGFCKQNGERFDVYTSHRLKSLDGRILCPLLRRYSCPYCGATGDNAHTRSYCSFARAAVKISSSGTNMYLLKNAAEFKYKGHNSAGKCLDTSSNHSCQDCQLPSSRF